MRKVSLQAAVARLFLTLPTPVTRVCSAFSMVTSGSRSLGLQPRLVSMGWGRFNGETLSLPQGAPSLKGKKQHSPCFQRQLRPGLSGETQPCPQLRVRDGGRFASSLN